MVTKSKDLLKARLERYLVKLKSGEKVNERDLKSVLTPAEIKSIQQDWENAQGFKQSVKDMGKELSSYTKMLHTADKIYGIAENHSNLPVSKRTGLYHKAEKHYERALEHLDEILASNPGVEIALDRSVSFDLKDASTPSSADVPRYVFSRAHHTQQREWETIKSIRIGALEEKLRSMDQVDWDLADDESEDEDLSPDEEAGKAKSLLELMRRLRGR